MRVVVTAETALWRMGLTTALFVSLCMQIPLQAQTTNAAFPDYTRAIKPFPYFYQPYHFHSVPPPKLSNAADAKLTVQDGKLRLSMSQLLAAVVANNLTVAAARYYPSIAQTDLLRARSGASPRGVDASVIPSVVFAGAEGGSILGTAGGGGGGSTNAGGVTGSASQVTVRPSGVFDPTLTVAFSVDHTASPLNTLVIAGVPEVTTGTRAFSVNYVQAFPSGTSIAGSYGYQRQGSTQLHLLFDPAFTPGFTASVSQQVLNGFGFKVNRTLIRVAQNELKIERESFRQQTIAMLASAQNAYWDLIAAREALRVAENALAVSQRLEHNNQIAFDLGVMARLDVLNAQTQVAASQRDLIVAQTNVQNAELQLKNMFSKNLDESLASAAIEPTDSLPRPEDAKLPALEEAIAVANSNRPEVSVAEGNIKSEQDVQPFLKNALLPNINAFALMTTVGLYNVFGSSFTEAIQFKYPQYAFGLSLTFPLRNRQAQADEVRSRLELRQATDILVRTKSQIEVDVQNALIATTQTKAQIAAAHQAVVLEEYLVDAEQKKLAAGISTSYNVILVQRDLFAAQFAEVQARDAYAKARVALDQAMGTTFENNGISLDDALREQ